MQRQVNQAQFQIGNAGDLPGVVDHIPVAHDVDLFAVLQKHLQVAAVMQPADELKRHRWQARGLHHCGRVDRLFFMGIGSG